MQSDYFSHILKHERERVCHDCGMVLPDHTRWRDHVINEHPGTMILECRSCEEGFQKPIELSLHRKSEHRQVVWESFWP